MRTRVLSILKSLSLWATIFFSPISLSSQDEFVELEAKWEAIKKYEKDDNQTAILQELINIEEMLSKINNNTRKRSLEIQKVYSYPIKLTILEQQLEHNDIRLAKAYTYEGIRNIMQNEIQKSKELLLRALEISGENSSSFRIYRWLGIANMFQENIKKSLEYFTKSIHAVSSYLDKESLAANRILCSIHSTVVSVHVNRGDLVSAKKHANLAIQYANRTGDDYYISSALLSKITAISNSESPEIILKFLKNHESQLSSLDNNGRQLYYNTQGRAYEKTGQYKKAIDAMEKAISYVSINQVNKYVCQHVIGECYYHLGQYDKAIDLYTALIPQFLKTTGNESSIAEAYYYRALSSKAKGELQNANSDILKALQLDGAYDDWKIQYYPLLSSIYMDYFDETGNENYLDSAKLMIEITDSLFTHIRIERRFFEDQINLGRRFYESYATNISVMNRIHEKEPDLLDQNKLFKYFENLKAYALKELLRKDDAVVIGNIPDSILVQEREYQISLAEMNKKIFELHSMSSDSSMIAKLDVQFDMEKESYFSFLKSLEKDYPGYYRHQYKNETIDLTEIQKLITDNEAILEYFVSENDIFLLIIYNGSCSFIRKTIPDNWSHIIEKFKNIIIDPNSSVEEFASLSRYLYSILLDEALQHVPSSVNRLRIVPDDVLNFIPFEILLTDSNSSVNNYKDLNYLIKNYTISYIQSASLLVHSNHNPKQKKTDQIHYVGFAPSYKSSLSDSLESLKQLRTRGNYLDLPFARKSVEQVSILFDGNMFVNESATLESFMKNAFDAKILHFAMHGVIDLDQPAFSHLLFYGKNEEARLYSNQVYGLDLNCDLVVLSACNTGIGKLINGDGIQNMSRAFNFAGVKNTIMSLWSVPDVQTAQLNYFFFNNIKKGEHIDRALQKAKMKFLKESTELRAHPYYWSGLVANGSMDVIEFSSDNNALLVLGGLILLTLMYIIWVKYFKTKFEKS